MDLSDLDPTIRLDIRYATKDNFAKAKVYPAAVCLLKKKPAEALVRAQKDLNGQGFGLKVYDCYRPLSVQKKFWALVPDERYVADPKKGSRHNRGYAVDATLLDPHGRELPMPSDYDDFSERAHRGAPAAPERARNSAILESALKKQGFVGLPTEWWHFDFPGWEGAPNLDVPFPRRVKAERK